MTDFSKILNLGSSLLSVAGELLPLASPIIGGTAVTAISGVATAVEEIIQNVQQRVSDEQIVLASNDEALIVKMTADLDAINQQLMTYVDQS